MFSEKRKLIVIKCIEIFKINCYYFIIEAMIIVFWKNEHKKYIYAVIKYYFMYHSLLVECSYKVFLSSISKLSKYLKIYLEFNWIKKKKCKNPLRYWMY